MTTEKEITKWLQVTKEVLKSSGFEVKPIKGVFPIVATNGRKVVPVYVSDSNLEESVTEINRLLSPIYFEKKFGSLSHEIHVAILCPKDVPDEDRISAESDAQICMKIVVPIGEHIEEDIQQELSALKPFSIQSSEINFSGEEKRLYVESLLENLKSFEPLAAQEIRSAFEQKWGPSEIVDRLSGELDKNDNDRDSHN